MAEKTLYILRHGESMANVKNVFASHRLDAPLSPAGIQEAQAASRWFRKVPISAAYSSPLLRARQTAEIVCAPLKLKPVFADTLIEMDVGDLEGKPQDDRASRAAFDRVLRHWERGRSEAGFPHGETLLDVGKRLRRFSDTIESDHHPNVLVVGHCLLFMAFIWLFCENHGPTLEFGHMGRGRISILRKMSEQFRLEQFDISPQQ